VPRVTEAFVHRAVRRYLVADGWTLVAGQWPGGTDDALHILYIVDPTVARDLSPDPRRHSLDKFVPDVVALKDGMLLIVEAKPGYSQIDYDKLQRLLSERRDDLYTALRTIWPRARVPSPASTGSVGDPARTGVQREIGPPACCLSVGNAARRFDRSGRAEGHVAVTTSAARSGTSGLSVAGLRSAVADQDWECWLADTRYLTHDIHRYSSKYIPQIARQAIEILTQPGDLVLDPMVGSGTTLVEAWLISRKAIGLDLNPLAVLIAKVKTHRVAQESVDETVAFLQSVAAALAAYKGGQLPLHAAPSFDQAVSGAAEDPRRTDPWFVKWFQPQILNDLLILDHAVQQIEDERARDVAWVAFSEILRRSSNAHSGYPNVMFDRKAPTKPAPGPVFVRTLLMYAGLVAQLSSVSGSEPDVQLADARRIDLPEGSVDAIVSHPPYIGSVPYAEYGLLSLKWFGVDNRALDGELLGGRRQSRDVIDRFQKMYLEMLGEAYRVLRPGRGMFLMVGDPVVRGALVDLAEMTRELATRVGFVEVATAIRRGVNRRANKMAHETLLFFQKPG